MALDEKAEMGLPCWRPLLIYFSYANPIVIFIMVGLPPPRRVCQSVRTPAKSLEAQARAPFIRCSARASGPHSAGLRSSLRHARADCPGARLRKLGVRASA